MPRRIAHRGFVSPDAAARGIAENTREALQLALDHGATHIETDCHLTTDGQVVLFHDTSLTHITGESVLVKDLTLEALESRMADRGGLITLGAALEVFPSARLNVDVKVAEAAETVGRIIAPHADRVLLTSFSDAVRRRAIDAALATGSEMPAASPGTNGVLSVLGALFTRSERLIAQSLERFDALQIPERQGPIRVLTPRLIEAAHRHGVEVHVWTVNDPTRMRELVDMGVDGIVTDRVDLATAVFAQ